MKIPQLNLTIIAHHNFVLDDFGAGEHVVRVKPTDEIVF
jgi:hypothetical protein